jgi:hypothetical protein
MIWLALGTFNKHFQPITYTYVNKKRFTSLDKKVKSISHPPNGYYLRKKTATSFVGKVQDQPFGLIMKGIAPDAQWNY